MPLSKLSESAITLLMFAYVIAAHGTTDGLTNLGLTFSLLGCVGSILWMTLRGKRWIGGAMIAVELTFFASYLYQNAGPVLRGAGAARMFGMLFLAVSFLTKSLVKREDAPKPKQVDKKLFWILAIVINAIDLLDFFANL